MSLKHVHVAFILGATLLALFCAVLAFGQFREDGAPLPGAAVAASLAAAVLLLGYESRFLRRCRREGIR